MALIFTLYLLYFNGIGSTVKVVADGSGDASAGIQAQIRSDQDLFFPKGTYLIGRDIRISNVRNLKIRGEKGTVFLTHGNKIITVSGNINNLEISGIEFVSKKVSTRDDSEGMIFIANYGARDVMDGIRISHCSFTNPENHSNGIKLVSEGLHAIARNISVTHNTFRSIGRMGVEFQNHITTLQRPRYSDFEICHNTFVDVGTIQLYPAPACISVSGYSLNGKINDNAIWDMRMDTSPHVYYGIENAGTIGLETIGNRIRSTSFGFTGILGSGPTEAHSRATGQPLKGKWIIRNNLIMLRGRAQDRDKIRGMELSHVDGYVISNNTVHVDGYAMMFINCRNGKISSNRVKVKAGNAMYFKEGSTGNVISGNTLDCSEGPDHGVLMFYGPTTTGNRAFENKLISNGGKAGNYVNYQGAKNNFK